MAEYRCCICGKPATVKYVQTINGVTKVNYYCDECAKLIDSGVSMDNLFQSMFDDMTSYHKPSAGKVCKCGMTERELINGGKFGCSECYNVFKDVIDDYMRRRGNLEHKGSSPNQCTTGLSEMEKLKAQLDKAVAEQRYLDADKISKQISALQKKESK